MRYKRYTFTLVEQGEEPAIGADIYLPILSQSLAECGFDSFEEMPEDQSLVAYLGERYFASLADSGVWQLDFLPLSFAYHAELCAEDNWNRRWEQEGFTPITLGEDLVLRAPHHPTHPECRYEVLLQPQCAFGCGAHDTTRMMLAFLLEAEPSLKGQRVLDVGCGTGVLGIAVALMGAKEVAFVDIDATAVENTRHNASLNTVREKGFFYTGILDELNLKSRSFDLIVANIHRNIILHDFPHYKRLLAPGGRLLVSGFYATEDGEAISSALGAYGFERKGEKESAGWMAISALLTTKP